MSVESAYARSRPTERVFSPVSLDGVFAALGYGATQQTLQDLLRYYGFNNREQFLTLEQQIKQALTGRSIQGDTALAFDKSASIVNPDYYQALTPYVYIAAVDFSNPVQAAAMINQWIEQKSGFRNVIDPRAVAYAVLVIVNTLRFKDDWVDKFEKSSTKPDRFTKLDGSRVQVPMMYQNKSMSYIQGPLTGIRKQFTDGATAEFVMGLPPDAVFTQELNYQYGKVDLYLPRFEIEKDIDIDTLLAAAGLGSVMSQNYGYINNLAIPSEIKQRVYIRVDEEGAEVRVVTPVMIALPAITMPPPTPVIRFDRPFHFRIIKNGQVLARGFYNAERETTPYTGPAEESRSYTPPIGVGRSAISPPGSPERFTLPSVGAFQLPQVGGVQIPFGNE